ncbi:MAG: 5-methyltetrahydropteroyltriglutamate--homocysteine S-methyltransferase [Pseudonocardia sp.]
MIMSPTTFHAEHVGSLLRPPALRAAFRRRRDGLISESDFATVQDDAIRDAVALQEGAGLHAITDGEFRRSSYWAHFVTAVDGLDIAPALFEFTDAAGGRMAFTAPLVTGRLRRLRLISGDEFVFLCTATERTPKITMPSPSTMHFWRGPEAIEPGAYPSVEELFADLVVIYREEITELAQLGCTYVQLDEVALAMLCDPAVRETVRRRGEDPEVLVDLYLSAVSDVVADRPAGMVAAMHVCRGNYKGHWMAEGGYEPVAEKVFGRSGVDALFLEFDSPRAGDFAPLRYVGEDTRVVLGLVSSKDPRLESREDLLRRIEDASRYVSVERLGISPQCGFASTVAGNPVTEDDEKRKLALVVEVAQEVWGR